MKTLFFTVTVLLTMSLSTLAAEPSKKPAKKSRTEKICEAIKTKIEDDCSHIMCDDAIAEGTFKDMDECVGGSDYAEAAQAACEDEPTLQDLVSKYNSEHSKTQIMCEE